MRKFAGALLLCLYQTPIANILRREMIQEAKEWCRITSVPRLEPECDESAFVSPNERFLDNALYRSLAVTKLRGNAGLCQEYSPLLSEFPTVTQDKFGP